MYTPATLSVMFRAVTAVAVLAILSLGVSAAHAEEDASRLAKLSGRALGFVEPGSVWELEWLTAQDRLTKTAGIELDYFIRGERCCEEQALHDLKRGRAHIAGLTAHDLASTVPELNILMAPFLFSTREEVAFVLENYLFQIFDELFAQNNLRLLKWVELGWNGVYSHADLRRPETARGMRLHGVRNPATGYFLEAIGATGVFLNRSELASFRHAGLLQGSVSSNVFKFSPASRHARYLVKTNHSYDVGAIVVNRKWFDAASGASQRLLRDSWAGKPAGVRGYPDKSAGGAEAAEVKLLNLSDAQRAAWRRVCAPVLERLVERVGGRSAEVVGAVRRGKRAYAALGATASSN